MWFTHTAWRNVSVNVQHYSSWKVSPKLLFDGWGHWLPHNDNHRVHWQRCRTRIHIQLLRKKHICFLIPNYISYKYILWIHSNIPSTESLFNLQLLKESTKGRSLRFYTIVNIPPLKKTLENWVAIAFKMVIQILCKSVTKEHRKN